ncbi:MAG: hypothetical protein KY464_04395 [Gemmatimonadetes bacterium]|nr:hypothetical protein [Gemmatimonadota bacterium]
MMDSSAFSEAIREISRELASGSLSRSRVNRGAIGVDQLGRRLHGVGMLRDREIADCLSAAVTALGEAHLLPEEERTSSVRRAISELNAAAAYADQGARPA